MTLWDDVVTSVLCVLFVAAILFATFFVLDRTGAMDGTKTRIEGNCTITDRYEGIGEHVTKTVKVCRDAR